MANAAPQPPVIDIESYQGEAWDALCGPAPNVLLYGGSRSGKTWLWVLWLVLRALAAPRATHAVLRHRFNHIKASIIEDTLPAVCERYWPGQIIYRVHRTDWYAEFVGGGRIWFGGLDDKERTEKILGQGHSSICLNECSGISYSSFVKASTRLAQSRGLALKIVCDENPPLVGHWTYRLWKEGRDPETRTPLPNKRDYAAVMMHPANNPHIPEVYKKRLQGLSPRDRARFWEGEFGAGTVQPLWTYESIERARYRDGVLLEQAKPDRLPEGIVRIVVCVDPSGCHGPEDKRSDEVGIVVIGVDDRGRIYVLEDASGRMGPSGKEGWGARACFLFYSWGAEAIVAETNFGGAMVAATILAVDPNVPVREVTASRGKAVRAEPVSVLYDRSRGFFCGTFPELEAQLVQFSSSGYVGDRSPDRADAMVWGAYALGVVQMVGQGHFDYVATEARKARGEPVPPEDAELPPGMAPPPLPPAPQVLLAPAHILGTVQARSGNAYHIENGRVLVRPDDVDDMRAIGFRPVEVTSP